MLSESTRSAIFELRRKGHGTRAIAHALDISRHSVCAVLKSGEVKVPKLERHELAEPLRDQIVAAYTRYKGHLGRVHEEMVKEHNATFSYQALTAFCRRHGIGHEPELPAGRYDFGPGEEMQHDTSPHTAKIAGVKTAVQIASVVLCYSRLLFFLLYPRFTRFECKHFLTEAVQYVGGSAARCMIDNTHVVVASGSGANMIPAPEMVAFAARFGFTWAAHEINDANRSARVENPFNRIQRGFLVGSEFADWADLQNRARATCDEWNAKFSNKLHASRRELFAVESTHLKALPIYIPEVYLLHPRTVDAEGYVHLNRVRYSVPYQLIGRRLEVRETMERVDLYEGPRKVASHGRVLGPRDVRVTDKSHRPSRGQGAPKPGPPPEETELLRLEPRLQSYIAGLRQHVGLRRRSLRQLLAMLRDYPREAFLTALAQAEQYGLFDLARVERMVLRQIATDYFVLPTDRDDSDNEE